MVRMNDMVFDSWFRWCEVVIRRALLSVEEGASRPTGAGVPFAWDICPGPAMTPSATPGAGPGGIGRPQEEHDRPGSAPRH